MKTAERFWDVIQMYNQSTFLFQIVICCLILLSIVAAYKYKLYFLPKLALSISNLFIAIVFFLIFDKSPVGYFFAFPLYMSISILLLVEVLKNTKVIFNRFDTVSCILLVLVLLYPLASFLLGHYYPKQVLYILPCPVISLSIVIYSRYEKKSIVLLILMTIWALTGIKAFIFNVLEDLILFAVSFYGIYLIITDMQTGRIPVCRKH